MCIHALTQRAALALVNLKQFSRSIITVSLSRGAAPAHGGDSFTARSVIATKHVIYYRPFMIITSFFINIKKCSNNLLINIKNLNYNASKKSVPLFVLPLVYEVSFANGTISCALSAVAMFSCKWRYWKAMAV